MELTALKADLIKATQTVQGIISGQATLPILANFLIEAKKETLKIMSTDLEIGITCSLKADILTEGSITIPAKKFSDIIKELPQEEAKITVKKNNAVEIRAGTAYFKLAGISKDEFPKLPVFTNKEFIAVQQGKLKKMLEMCVFAVSKDESRYVLSGVLLEAGENRLKTTATDGRRLAQIEEKTELPQKLNKKIIIPQKTAQELIRNLQGEGDVKIIFSDNQACFETTQIIITTRLIEGEYPDCEKVIPKETKEKLIINKNSLLKAIKRVALFSNPESVAIKMDIIKDKVLLFKNTPDLGEARDEVEARYEGKELSVGFNPAYLTDILKASDKNEAELEITDPQKPAVMREKGRFVFIVLPMQLA